MVWLRKEVPAGGKSTRLPFDVKTEYPDELTCDQIECYKTLRIFEDLKKAKDYSDKTKGHIYTQIDGDGGIMYSRGIRFVNRTGIYGVIKR